jgi:hypothetical protein
MGGRGCHGGVSEALLVARPGVFPSSGRQANQQAATIPAAIRAAPTASFRAGEATLPGGRLTAPRSVSGSAGANPGC